MSVVIQYYDGLIPGYPGGGPMITMLPWTLWRRRLEEDK